MDHHFSVASLTCHFRMKTKLLLVLPLAILLPVSCQKSEEPAAATKTKAQTLKPLAERAKSHAPAESPAAEPPAPTEDAASPVTSSSSSLEPIAPAAAAPAVAASPAAPAAPTAPHTLTPAERDAYNAEQRAKRATQMSAQMTTRLKERDTNGDGLLQKSELSERMQRGFDRSDTNGDGVLDASEQEAMIKTMSERTGNDNNRRDRRGATARRGGGGGNNFGRGN